jgi:hypothetical protein
MPDHQHKDTLIALLSDLRALTSVRNSIIHGQYLGRGDQFGFELRSRSDSFVVPDVLDEHAQKLKNMIEAFMPFIQEQPDGSNRLPVQWRQLGF